MASAILKLYFLAALAVVVKAKTATERTKTFSDDKIEGAVFDDFTNTSQLNTAYSNYRLSTNTLPVHYNLFWEVDMENKTFSGTVEILLRATNPYVDEIRIHSAELTLESISLNQDAPDASDIPVRYVQDDTLDLLRIIIISGRGLQYDAVNPVIYSLKISFAAPFRTDMHGIYTSSYDNRLIWPDGTIDATDPVISIASTQFKATYARYAFPCYDEPKYKATFDVTISVPSGYSIWFCTLRSGTRPGNTGYQEDVFIRTPIMSTYQLGFVVASDFNTIMNHHPDGHWRHIIARRTSARFSDLHFAFDIGYESIDKMSEHTGIDYYTIDSNLRKMTQVALPVFAGEATENWGLISTREADMLYDSNHGSDYVRNRIATILSKRIAQMWFGNLVTPEFWDCLWLSEGFGTYYEYFLPHWINFRFIGMGLDRRFVVEQVHTGLLSDSEDTPHPLTYPNIGSPASIDAMFSSISSSKGAAVIRMTEHLLGFEVHRQGLQNYLRNRYLDVAVPNDLFQALQDVAVTSGAIAEYGSDFSVIDYYRSWTEKAGYPVLYVNVNHETGAMSLQQRRFKISTGYYNDDSLWVIPITFATASNPDFANTKPSHIIKDPVVNIINRGTTGDEWVIFNKQQTGFYRVNYDEYTWDLIIVALRGEDRTKIHELNRAQIVDDVFQFARSGIMSYTRAFNILSFLENETEYAPWAAAMNNLRWLRDKIASTPSLARLDEVIVRWATRAMNEVTYYPVAFDSFMLAYLRWQLASMMCDLNVRECREAANTQFHNLVHNDMEITRNNRDVVYCNALREGSEEDFDFLWARYEHTNLDFERLQILRTIGCTPHASRINFFMDKILEDNLLIQKQDYEIAFNAVLNGNEENTFKVFYYIQDNLAAFINAFGSADLVSNIVARMRSSWDVFELQDWAIRNRIQLGDSYETIIETSILTIYSFSWSHNVANDLNNYFTNGDDSISASTAAPANLTTEGRPVLEVPETPDIPDSAVSTVLSVFAVLIALLAQYAL